MRMDKLTSKFQMALAEAQSLAVGQDHQFIEPAHVMVALLDQQVLEAFLAFVELLLQLHQAFRGEQAHPHQHVAGFYHLAGDHKYLFNSYCLLVAYGVFHRFDLSHNC